MQKFLFLLFIKSPTSPFHTWLPIAHGESSTGTSVILAAILLKFATFGFIRYTLPLFPLASKFFLPLIFTISIISIIYSCILALSLIDFKALIAYSSVIHMNISNIGIFSNDINGLSGSFIYSLSHGLISGGLFLLVGMLYSRYHTKNIKYYRGLSLIMPLFILFLFLFNLSNLSFPLSLGFIAENLILFRTIDISPFLTLFTSLACLLLPIVMIWTFQRISFGRISNYLPVIFSDLNIKEINLIFSLFLFSTILGIQPQYLLESIFLPLSSIII
jgi:NADH:ubiquinone oxidoreductase subunit 4 (subunit M)